MLLDEYYKRIDRYVQSIEEIELKDGDEKTVEERFRKAIPKERGRVVALEVLGKRVTSDGLAKIVGSAELDGVQTLTFLIGGSYGLPKSISKAADIKLSLSDMTLPHRLARVLLAEQVYRAFTILRSEPYSH